MGAMGDEEHGAKGPVPGKEPYVVWSGKPGKLPDQAATLLEARIHRRAANIP